MTWAVVGAGYTGIAVAGALIEAGLDVDVLDGRPAVGGLWLDSVYDSVRLITTRKVTAYGGHPMPDGPTFPSGPELLAYLTSVAADTGVLERLLPGEQVTSVRPSGEGWVVSSSTDRHYEGVILATGLFQTPRIPPVAGTLTIPALHTADYRGVSQLGEDILVVGLGNSGADVAHEAVKAGKRVTMAVRGGRHVVPKRVLGLPVVEMRRPDFVPDLPVRIALDLTVRALSAYWRTGRLPEPRHIVLSESPVVHSALLPLVANGRIAVRPALCSVDGDRVTFADGTSATFDSVVWATGYDYALPVERMLLDGLAASYREQPPSLVGGAWSPLSRGLAAVGHREPRHGRGPYLSALSRAVAAGAVAQGHISEPIGAVLGRVVPSDATTLIDDGPELRRLRQLTAAAHALY